jgi:hypothetical protein
MLICYANSLSEEHPFQNYDNIFNGNIEVTHLKNPDGISGIKAVFAVKSSKDNLFRILTDYSNLQNVFNDIDNLKVLKCNAGEALIETHFLFIKLKYTLLRKLDFEKSMLYWSQVDGDLDVVEGSWSVIDIPERKMLVVTYESYVKYGRIEPTNVIRWLASKKTKKMVLSLIRWAEK